MTTHGICNSTKIRVDKKTFIKIITRSLIGLSFLLKSGAPVVAHEFTIRTTEVACRYAPPGSDALMVIIEGAILPGMAFALDKKIKEVNESIPSINEQTDKNYVLCEVDFLEVPGGDVYEAMEVGRVIRKHGLSTTTAFAESYCFSACVLAFAGGVFRISFDKKIGIHSFYSPAFLGSGSYEENEELFNSVYNDIEKYLREMRVPRAILDSMVSVSYRGIKLLDMRTLTDMGFLGVDPVFDQVTPRYE